MDIRSLSPRGRPLVVWAILWALPGVLFAADTPSRPPDNPVANPPGDTAHPLRWDALSKVYNAKLAEQSAPFEFRVTNVSSSDVTIKAVHTSCGCTIAHLPPLPDAPLVLAANASVSLGVTLDLSGKTGSLSKTVTVESSAGFIELHLTANIDKRSKPPETGPAPHAGSETASTADRAKNMQAALGDRQAVFKGDCARCHAEPGHGKMGDELYAMICAICHDAVPRAAMVPDLRSPRSRRDAAFWTKWIAEGAPNTMMPAFAAKHGGPLTPTQVESLSAYLYDAFPRNPADESPTAPKAASGR